MSAAEGAGTEVGARGAGTKNAAEGAGLEMSAAEGAGIEDDGLPQMVRACW
jgi:hypothetical protein